MALMQKPSDLDPEDTTEAQAMVALAEDGDVEEENLQYSGVAGFVVCFIFTLNIKGLCRYSPVLQVCIYLYKCIFDIRLVSPDFWPSALFLVWTVYVCLLRTRKIEVQDLTGGCFYLIQEYSLTAIDFKAAEIQVFVNY